MIKVSAPGKLFLSGEWAVLEVGNPGLVTAVNKRVFAELEEADKISITIDDFGIKDLGASFDGSELKWERELSDAEKEQTQFIKASIETALKYLGVRKVFRIRSWGEESQIEIDGVAKKVGFGSSAASVVATVAGILALNGQDIESKEARDRIYKLSAITHYFAQGKIGSAFDVAASTYGGVFVYQRFDPKWLEEKLNSGQGVREIVDQDWPAFRAEPLEIPEGFRLIIGWTKESASTSAMVKQLNTWAEGNREEYKRLYDQIANLVRELIPAWKDKNKERILELVRKNEGFLKELGEASGVNIETPDLNMLSESANQAGAAGKLSGAGGGDCGIAVCFDSETAEKVKNGWEEKEFYLVDATIDYNGVKAE
jgi:phosphomevalonate kinase